MVLFAELLPAQPEQHVHLVGQISGIPETLAEQRDLGDELGVRHHHRYGAEHGFQIVGQLGPAGVPGIHGDEYAARRFQADLVALEREFRQAGLKSRVNGQYLLRHDRQHFDVDPVELVETAPGALLG